ncbi:MAG: phosphatidate cytidylyltransferase [Burkholderiales bacterium]|jgi:phosphatidate cytidylyltransferase|nr:phosphatidate cytidylyltransferase [Burkholderiales bacterium]
MLRARVATVAVLLPLFVGGMFFLGQIWWALLLLPLLLAGGREWAALAGFSRNGNLAYCGILAASAAVLLWGGELHRSQQALDAAIFGIAVAFWFLLAPLWLWRGWRLRDPLFLGLTGWILVVPTWLALVRLQQWPWVLLAVLGVVWVADSAAYFAGHFWGRRKLAPSISPGKTWEGVAGAAIGVAVYHALVWKLGFSVIAPQSAGAAALLVAVLLPLSIIGDLFESWIKRQAGVKDSGNLLPGHGGVLDRIDALTATLPLAALAVPWLLLRT